MRTGLLKVGLPGAKEGLSDKDPTLAELLKPLGYTTGQFGKNHLGDRNEFLPTVHGFDEFFGNLYHLNAEDEPEHPDYPKNLQFRLRFGPRGVLRCTATLIDPGEDPRFGPWGKQSCTDTGPLTKKRMETVDQELLTATLDFMDRANDAMPEQKAQAEGVLRETLNSVWDEFESVMKDISHDAAKELAKTGLSLFVLNYMIAPLLRRLRPHRNNPILAETARRLQTIADKLEADHHAQLDERNVAIWTGVSPPEAQLLLRAIKLRHVVDHWELDTQSPGLSFIQNILGPRPR
jgi:hypothetical protein